MEFITLDMVKNLNLDELYKLYENHYNSSLYKSFKLVNIDINFVKQKVQESLTIMEENI